MSMCELLSTMSEDGMGVDGEETKRRLWKSGWWLLCCCLSSFFPVRDPPQLDPEFNPPPSSYPQPMTIFADRSS